jgi:lipopolysaccharide heptosyltransferase II
MGTHLRESLLYHVLRLVRLLDRRHVEAADLDPRKIRRILLVSSTAIGDTLLSTPAFRSMRLAYPQAHISLLAHAGLIELFADNPDIDEVIPYHGGFKRFFRLAWQLRGQRFDLACILHGNEPQATPLAYLSGAPFIFKLPNTSQFRFLLTNRERVEQWEDLGHGIDQRLSVAYLAKGAPTDRRMTLPVNSEAEGAVTQWLSGRGAAAATPLAAFQPGASTHSRRWAPSRFIELGRRLLDADAGLRIVLTGSPAERALAERIAEGIADARVIVAAGELPLRLLPALLKRCATLVSGDTGPMHVAVAVGTPVVALFAVSDHRRSGPPPGDERHIVIQKWRTCDPCLSKRCPYDEPICMENISVDEVHAAVRRQLQTAVAR